MIIRRLFTALFLVSISVWAQSGGLGSMRDPRTAGSQNSLAGSIEPWLAVSGSYDTALDQPDVSVGSVRRSVSVSGGLSMTKSFQRTIVAFGYAGAGTDYMGRTAGLLEGWTSSNVVSLAVSSQVTQRVTLDFAEAGGAANGGFGAASAGMLSGGLGVLGSLNVAGGYLSGAGAGLGAASSGLDTLANNLVDSDHYQQMTYFSSTSANAGFLLSSRTMLNVGGSGSFIRRDGRSFSDANMVGANAMLSTELSRRFSTFFGYSFNRIDFIQSIRDIYVQGGFAGISYQLSPHDQFSMSVSDSYMDMKAVSSVALPPDVAALLGVNTTTVVVNNSRSFLGGRLSYLHAFQRGGFNMSCSSSIAPGNDLILMARTDGCTASLSRMLTPRFSVNGIAGARRLNSMTQAGSRYDVLNGGLLLSYRVFRGLSFTAGANYNAMEIHPSMDSRTWVTVNAGLRWSPRDEINLF